MFVIHPLQPEAPERVWPDPVTLAHHLIKQQRRSQFEQRRLESRLPVNDITGTVPSTR